MTTLKKQTPSQLYDTLCDSLSVRESITLVFRYDSLANEWRLHRYICQLCKQPMRLAAGMRKHLNNCQIK
jgi:hypothetical protein